MSRAKYVKSKDGKDRTTVRVEIRLTPEEMSTANLLFIEFKESLRQDASTKEQKQTADWLTFAGYLAILLRGAIADKTNERFPDGLE